MRRSRFADRPETAVAPRTLSQLVATDEAVRAAERPRRHKPRGTRTLRNTT
ncbi:hypothetical protein [Actinomadura rupiterrae]|uniref:hypothetical protein n=1 Tax=Actinomadura rupiterrae TaxID=559627 RepID=UPI0020A2B314|nr:hypothetical protein [Actinomadura rupiterrae]MCP2340440.1 hypothetical protein [Actinomadura rupiterrae]